MKINVDNKKWILWIKLLLLFYLIGNAHDLFYELAYYNLGCLQYYVGNYERSYLSCK